jgi:glyoxylase-like metal-dependent hydrolase (beta-lactamase superfamily II)
MMQIERLVFNPFQENTYIVYDESGEALIVDPGCYGQEEEKKLESFLANNHLKPKYQIFTHTHVDHILGSNFVYQKYGLKPVLHRDALPFLQQAAKQGQMYGFEIDEIIPGDTFLDAGDTIVFGQSQLEVLHTPGHVDGHLCFVSKQQKFVLAGDVLFRDSIGRTDLPTGDFDVLARNIRTQLFTLGHDYTVYPGHGPATTIGYEIFNNPFVNGS